MIGPVQSGGQLCSPHKGASRVVPSLSCNPNEADSRSRTIPFTAIGPFTLPHPGSRRVVVPWLLHPWSFCRCLHPVSCPHVPGCVRGCQQSDLGVGTGDSGDDPKSQTLKTHVRTPNIVMPLLLLAIPTGCGVVSVADQLLIQSTWRFLGVCGLAVATILALSLIACACLRNRHKP